MSTTKYIYDRNFDGMRMTPETCKKVREDLSNGCIFTCALKISVQEYKQYVFYPVPCFRARYYVSESMIHYHISNDDRRKLVKCFNDMDEKK